MTSNLESGLDSSIALRFDEGISYGAVVWIKGTDIKVQSSARLQPGDVVEFRMELSGRPEAPYGLLLVLEAFSGSLDSSPSFRGSLLRMEDSDLRAMNAWVASREFLHYTGSGQAQLDLSDNAHQALHAPEAAAARQRYQENKGRLRADPDILRGPFESDVNPLPATDSLSVPSVTTEDPDFPPPVADAQNQASGYLRSMSRRGKARARRPLRSPTAPSNRMM